MKVKVIPQPNLFIHTVYSLMLSAFLPTVLFDGVTQHGVRLGPHHLAAKHGHARLSGNRHPPQCLLNVSAFQGLEIQQGHTQGMAFDLLEVCGVGLVRNSPGEGFSGKQHHDASLGDSGTSAALPPPAS